jgi:transposase-like protein
MTDTQAFVEISSRSAAELAEKYLALWNEPDAERRGRMIAGLWTQDGRHILQPPQEIRGIAARPGLAMTAILEARGYEEIEARAASAYEHWVGSEGLSFRGRDDAERLGDVVKFHWEVSEQTLRSWRPRRDVDAGLAEGLTTDECEELRRLRRENRRLAQQREIRKAAAAFFARRPIAGDMPRTDRRDEVTASRLPAVQRSSASAGPAFTRDRRQGEICRVTGLGCRRARTSTVPRGSASRAGPRHSTQRGVP